MRYIYFMNLNTLIYGMKTDKGKRDAGLWMGIQIMENLTAALLWMQSGRKECAAFLSGFFDELMEFSIGTGQCRDFYTDGDAAFR